MKRADVESRFIEILTAGGEPMDDPQIRDAISTDTELATELDRLREFVLKLDGLEWPELDETRRIDHITEAFEEGFRQGRMQAAQQIVPGTSWFGRMWQFAAVATAMFIVVAAGTYMLSRTGPHEQVTELRNDLRNLQEMVAVSMLENQSASQRLLGVRRTRNVDEPGARLLTALSSTMRSDPVTNVRLAAADEMVRFANREEVRDALYETTLLEADPFVQSQLIDVLLVVRYPTTKGILTQLAESQEVSEVVRLKATAALNQIGDTQ